VGACAAFGHGDVPFYWVPFRTDDW
jgi:hypothetical protein